MALLPIFLYALLHAANFSVQACNATGYGATLYARKVAELTNKHTQSLLGVIACSEVFIVPIFIAMIFTLVLSFFLDKMVQRHQCGGDSENCDHLRTKLLNVA